MDRDGNVIEHGAQGDSIAELRNVAGLRCCIDHASAYYDQRQCWFTGGNGYAHACIGCAHFDALKNQSFLSGSMNLLNGKGKAWPEPV